MTQTVLVTGGARGIGKAVCRAFLEAGANVIINYNNSAAAAAELVNEFGEKRVLAAQADVSRAEDVQAMIDAALAKFGAIDVLVNNAGIANSKIITDQTEAEWDLLFNTNVKGAFLCTRAVLPQMINRKSGCIINISSIWGQVGASCEVSYSASKGAIDAFTKALAKEVGPSGIRVNAVSPGVINTDMNGDLTAEDMQVLADHTPLCRIGQPEDIAQRGV